MRKFHGKYNIPGQQQLSNLELAEKVAKCLGKELKYEMRDCHSSGRDGHDLGYKIDGTRLFDLGFTYPVSFDDAIEKTVEWYLKPENLHWLQ